MATMLAAAQSSQVGQESRSVFVGNIPYTATEEQLQEVFESAGPVLSFRLVRNDMGQTKGYGFCEFREDASVEVAIRNLNNYEMNGRLLRVDQASSNKDNRGQGPSLAELAGPQAADKGGAEIGAAPLDAITSTVNTMTANQIYAVMGQLRGIVMQNKDQASLLLTQNPQLSVAFLRMQERLDMLGGIQLAPPPVTPVQPQPLVPPTKSLPIPHSEPHQLHHAPMQAPPLQQIYNPPPHVQHPPPQQPIPQNFPSQIPPASAAPMQHHTLPHMPAQPQRPPVQPQQGTPSYGGPPPSGGFIQGAAPPQVQQQQAPQGAPAGGAGSAGQAALQAMLSKLSPAQLEQLNALVKIPPERLEGMNISEQQKQLIKLLRQKLTGS